MNFPGLMPTLQNQNTLDLLKTAITHPRLGLVLDFDGTLSPITDHPDQSRATERNRQFLLGLQGELPLVAVISGRAAADVAARLGLPGLVYLGNHGFERLSGGKKKVEPSVWAYRPAIEKACVIVGALLEPGEHIEDKGVTASFHYRQARSPQSAEARLQPILESIAADHGLVLTRGRMVFELRPPLAIDKGTALEALVQEFRLTAVIYMGDDTTDIAALQTAQTLSENGRCTAVGIAVDSPETPLGVMENAAYSVPGISGVETFLEALLSDRRASST